MGPFVEKWSCQWNTYSSCCNLFYYDLSCVKTAQFILLRYAKSVLALWDLKRIDFVSQYKVKVPERQDPMLVLKFIWMEKNIGIALDQLVPGYGSIPLSPYYFWPRKDAWEELRAKLEEKEWISQKQMIILLNQATDIINLWQQGGGSLST